MSNVRLPVRVKFSFAGRCQLSWKTHNTPQLRTHTCDRFAKFDQLYSASVTARTPRLKHLVVHRDKLHSSFCLSSPKSHQNFVATHSQVACSVNVFSGTTIICFTTDVATGLTTIEYRTSGISASSDIYRTSGSSAATDEYGTSGSLATTVQYGTAENPATSDSTVAGRSPA
jgi:hypothetical protein